MRLREINTDKISNFIDEGEFYNVPHMREKIEDIKCHIEKIINTINSIDSSCESIFIIDVNPCLNKEDFVKKLSLILSSKNFHFKKIFLSKIFIINNIDVTYKFVIE